MHYVESHVACNADEAHFSQYDFIIIIRIFTLYIEEIFSYYYFQTSPQNPPFPLSQSMKESGIRILITSVSTYELPDPFDKYPVHNTMSYPQISDTYPSIMWYALHGHQSGS